MKLCLGGCRTDPTWCRRYWIAAGGRETQTANASMSRLEAGAATAEKVGNVILVGNGGSEPRGSELRDGGTPAASQGERGLLAVCMGLLLSSLWCPMAASRGGHLQGDIFITLACQTPDLHFCHQLDLSYYHTLASHNPPLGGGGGGGGGIPWEL